MQLDLSSDQEFFRDTTAKFLGAHSSADEVRRRRDHEAGFDAGEWRRGAELGWTSLLVSEDHGGGSISGRGAVDLCLVAHEFGRRSAPGPLAAVAVVASALSATGSHPDVLAGLLSGDAVATWALGEGTPASDTGDVALTITPDGDELVIDGVKRPVESAAQASHILVTGRTNDGISQVLVPTDTPGLTIGPMRTIDLVRRFSKVTFDAVRVPASAAVGAVGGAGAQVQRQLLQTLVVLNAETIGAMQAAFELTVEWAFDRYSFGRPLASYQALKHRFADMKSWLEGGHAVNDAAAIAVADGASDAAELASAAKAFLAEYGLELIQDCVQMHGGIGVTYEHDLHLYLRRATVNSALFGTGADHRRRVAAEVAVAIAAHDAQADDEDEEPAA